MNWRQPAPIVLTIAGSDSSGGAGVQADLKTFSALRCYGASVITSLTAQNTMGVSAIHYPPAAFVAAQVDAVFSDLDIGVVKIGMAGDEKAIEEIAEGLTRWCRVPVVLDPVMVAASGDTLLLPQAELSLRKQLFPLSTLITPNLDEAAKLLGVSRAEDEGDMRKQAEWLFELAGSAVLLKGGHGTGPEAVDLFFDGETCERLALPRINTSNTHGTGCTLSAAIATFLAHGASLLEAVQCAKNFVNQALVHADSLSVGKGHGPVHHFHGLWPEKTNL